MVLDVYPSHLSSTLIQLAFFASSVVIIEV